MWPMSHLLLLCLTWHDGRALAWESEGFRRELRAPSAKREARRYDCQGLAPHSYAAEAVAYISALRAKTDSTVCVAASEGRRKWGHSSFAPQAGKRGRACFQARPLLLANEECPHFLPPERERRKASPLPRQRNPDEPGPHLLQVQECPHLPHLIGGTPRTCPGPRQFQR